nr:myosin heavy chain, non-muscle-like [Cherax quadricarinatus]
MVNPEDKDGSWAVEERKGTKFKIKRKDGELETVVVTEKSFDVLMNVETTRMLPQKGKNIVHDSESQITWRNPRERNNVFKTFSSRLGSPLTGCQPNVSQRSQEVLLLQEQIDNVNAENLRSSSFESELLKLRDEHKQLKKATVSNSQVYTCFAGSLNEIAKYKGSSEETVMKSGQRVSVLEEERERRYAFSQQAEETEQKISALTTTVRGKLMHTGDNEAETTMQITEVPVRPMFTHVLQEAWNEIAKYKGSSEETVMKSGQRVSVLEEERERRYAFSQQAEETEQKMSRLQQQLEEAHCMQETTEQKLQQVQYLQDKLEEAVGGRGLTALHLPHTNVAKGDTTVSSLEISRKLSETLQALEESMVVPCSQSGELVSCLDEPILSSLEVNAIKQQLIGLQNLFMAQENSYLHHQQELYDLCEKTSYEYLYYPEGNIKQDIAFVEEKDGGGENSCKLKEQRVVDTTEDEALYQREEMAKMQQKLRESDNVIASLQSERKKCINTLDDLQDKLPRKTKELDEARETVASSKSNVDPLKHLIKEFDNAQITIASLKEQQNNEIKIAVMEDKSIQTAGELSDTRKVNTHMEIQADVNFLAFKHSEQLKTDCKQEQLLSESMQEKEKELEKAKCQLKILQQEKEQQLHDFEKRVANVIADKDNELEIMITNFMDKEEAFENRERELQKILVETENVKMMLHSKDLEIQNMSKVCEDLQNRVKDLELDLIIKGEEHLSVKENYSKLEKDYEMLKIFWDNKILELKNGKARHEEQLKSKTHDMETLSTSCKEKQKLLSDAREKEHLRDTTHENELHKSADHVLRRIDTNALAEVSKQAIIDKKLDELEHLKDENALKTKECDHMRNTIDNLKIMVSKKDDSIKLMSSSHDKELSSYSETLNKKNEVIYDLENMVRMKGEEAISLRSALEAKDHKLKRLECDLKAVQQILDSNERNYQEFISGNEIQISSKIQELNDVIKLLNKMDSMVIHYNKEKAFQVEMFDELQQKCKLLETELSETELRYVEVVQSYKSSVNQVNMNKILEEKKELQSSIVSLKEELSNTNKELAKKERLCMELNAEMDDIVDHYKMKANKNVFDTLATQKSENVELRQQIQRYKENVDNLVQSKAVLQEKLKISTDTVGSLIERLGEKDKLSPVYQEKDALENKLAENKSEMEAVIQSASNENVAFKKTDILTQKVKMLEDELETARISFKDLSEKHDDMKKEYTALHNECKELRACMAKKEILLEQNKDNEKLREANTLMSCSSSDTSGLNLSKRSKKSKTFDLEMERDNLRELYIQLANKNEILESTIDSLRRSQGAVSTVEEFQRELTWMREKMEASEKQRDLLSSNYNILEKDFEALRKEVECLRENKKQLDAITKVEETEQYQR